MKLGPTFKALTSNVGNPANWLIEYMNGGTKSKSGVDVNVNSVLGLAPVLYAVNKIGGHVAGMKIDIKKRNADGSIEIVNNNISRLLNTAPNDLMTAYTVREMMMTHLLLAGNARAYISRNSNGTPVGLLPIPPQYARTAVIDGLKYHLITPEKDSVTNAISDALLNGGYYKVPDRDMLHIMNVSYNGLWGLNLVQVAKNVFGLTQAGQDGASVAIANSGRPGMLLQAPNGAFRTAEDAQTFLDNFNAKHEGLDGTGKTAMLKDGMTAQVLPISQADAQVLGQRDFQRGEIAMMFGLESYPGDNSGQTYKSITERNTAYVNNTLSRFTNKWAQEIDKKLIPYGGLYSSFDSSSLQYGDPNSLASYTQTMTTAGIMTLNELRAVNDLGAVEGGDEVMMAQNQRIAQEQLDAAAESKESDTNDNEPENKDTEE